MEKRLIDIDVARKRLCDMAVESNFKHEEGDAKFCLDVAHLLETFWKMQNGIGETDNG